MRRPLFPLLALIALAGCADTILTVAHHYPMSPSVARLHLQDAGTAGPVLLEVRDNPFPDDAARTLAAAASRTSVGFLTRFTAVRSEAARPDFRVVVQFDPAGGTGGGEVCNPGARIAHAGRTERLSALVAFCHQTQPILSVATYSARPDRADTPVIKALAEQAMLRMFLPDGQDRESPDDYWPD